MAKTRSEINNAFAKKAYDDLRVQVPKGRRTSVKAFAESHGESINGLINRLLRVEMGLSEQEWKEKEEAGG